MRKYLYCVIKEKTPRKFNILGQEEKEVHTLVEGGLAMVVSDTSKDDYPFIKECLAAHQETIEKVMKEGYDVLPARFGTVAKDDKDIKEKILKAKRKELLETFPIAEGRVELGLRALWKDMPCIFQEILAASKEIQTVKKMVSKNPSQFAVAKVGELIQKAVNFQREEEAQKLLKPLKELAVKFRERELIKSSEPWRD